MSCSLVRKELSIKLKKIIFNRDATPVPTNFIATGYNVAEQVP
jgi:hypothetical protein